MIDYHVCRGSSIVGDCSVDDPLLNWGPDIVDELLTTEEAAKERGRVAIDAEYTNRKEVTIRSNDVTHKQPSSMMLISDGPKEIRGLLREVEFSVTRTTGKPEVHAVLKIEANI